MESLRAMIASGFIWGWVGLVTGVGVRSSKPVLSFFPRIESFGGEGASFFDPLDALPACSSRSLPSFPLFSGSMAACMSPLGVLSSSGCLGVSRTTGFSLECPYVSCFLLRSPPLSPSLPSHFCSLSSRFFFGVSRTTGSSFVRPPFSRFPPPVLPSTFGVAMISVFLFAATPPPQSCPSIPSSD